MSEMVQRGARKSGVAKESGGELSNNGVEATQPGTDDPGRAAGVAGLAMEGAPPVAPAEAWVETVGAAAAREVERLRKQGFRNFPTKDVRIAAIALAEGATLLSANLQHFQPISGLDVQDWLREGPPSPLEGEGAGR